MADEIRLPVSADTTQMERNIADATRRVGSINLNANVDSRGMENFNRSLGKITGQADEFSKSMEAANARVLAFGASVGVINAISNAFKGLVSSTIEVEKSLTEIKIIGNETFRDLSKTSAGLFSTAKQLGVSYKDAADATLEFARQGKGLTESLNASKAALALTRTAGISATEAVMGLTSAVNAFGRGADAYIEYANKMSAVSDAFAVNNKDLIEGLSRSASVAQEAGVSFEQVTALITTLQEKTGRGGAVIGNALKTIFTRVQNPEIIKDLRDLGISVQDATTGAFLPATQIIQNLANEFQGFDKNLRNSVLLKVGGGFQVDKLAALLNDVKDASGTYQRSLNIATSGSGDILGRVAKLNQTIDSSFTNILTSSKQLGANIGQIAFSKDFTNILQNGASLISSLNDAIFGSSGDAEDQGSAIGKAVLKGLGSVISGPGLFALFGIFTKLSIDFVKFSTEGVKALVGIASKTKEEQLIQGAITNALSRNADFQKQIFNLEGNRVAQAELLLGVIRQQVNESKKLEDISKNAASALYGRGVRLSGGNPQIVGSATNSAKGYIPNLADAIAKEKSESPAGSRIIVDRNFPMGGGERSTMVYNSNETRIKNFAGTGGDAIIPNYPINSAKGFVPNFAKKQKKAVQDDGRKSLEVDAANLSVAGLTFAGENKGSIKRAKPVPIDEDLLAKYSGSPYVKVLEQFKNFTLTNVPVGNVYRLRKGLQQSEDEIKADFLQKLNSKFREQTISFLLEEINGLGLPTGGGVGKNLSNLKLNVIGSSTAGYIFEEILKIPTLSDAEKVAQYASQSDTDYFDIKNLSPEFSEAYGLPKRAYDLVELKFGERELKDGISKKFLNQLVAEGGGANPKKFGQKDTNRAARGYIPNFAESIGSLKSRMKGSSQKGSGYLQNYYDVENLGFNDSYNANIPVVRFSFKKSLERYTRDAENVIADYKDAYAKDKKSGSTEEVFVKKWKNKYDEYLTSSFKGSKGYENLLLDPDNDPNSPYSGVLRNIKGALGEKTFDEKFKGWTREPNEKAGIDFYKGDEMMEIKVRGAQFTQEEANAKALAFLGSKSPKKDNEVNDIINLSDKKLYLYETFKNANKDLYQDPNKYLNAAKGYIPNFSELTGSGVGMLYQDTNFKELGGGQSGKFLAPKSGEGFGQKIFYKTGSDKINQEYQVNKSIKDFEKENPALFAKNAISFTNVGKLLTKNGLAAGFEREVIGGLGVDEFATGTFSKGGAISPKTNFAFFLSELLAQSGVKNVVGEYRNKYGQNSLGIDDVYAQNFKVNDIMQKLLIDETNQFFKGKKKVTDSDVNNYIRSLNGNPLINSLNEKFGAAGGRHTMFDTQGFAKNASKGYIPNFANLSADILTVNPAVAKMSVDQFIEKYLGSQYSTGLSGTSANALKITGSPQQMMEAKRDFIMSMLGPNFLATYQRNDKANDSRSALIRQKSKSTGTRVKKQGGFMRAYGDYAQTDLSAALEGTFSGNAKRLTYEDLDTKAEKIFQQNNLTQYWNEIVKTMQLVGEAYRSESVSANNTGRKMDFDYSRIEVPEEGKFKYGLQQTYKAKEKIRELTALIRPKLIEGLLEGEKGVQGLVLNQPEYDKEGGVEGDYLVLLDAKAAQLKKLVSDYLINPDLDPLQIGSPEQSQNKFRIREIINALDGPFGSGLTGKGIFLDQLKQFRNYSKGNPQLQKFFMDGEDKPGAFLVQKASQGGGLGAFLKPDLPQNIIEKIATVLASSYNRDGIFQLSNLDVGYAGQLSYAGSKNNPLLDTFATSPQSAASIPSTLKYEKYLEKKDYYKSVAKWKYDPASKSMIRQAAKGYIPNFAKKVKNKKPLDPNIKISNLMYDDPEDLEEGETSDFDPYSFIATYRGDKVGTLNTRMLHHDNGVYVDGIEVDEDFRKMGIGKALYTELKKSLMPGSKVIGDIIPQHMDEWSEWGENNLDDEKNEKLKRIRTIEGLKMIYPQLSRIDLSRNGTFKLSSSRHGYPYYEITEKTSKTDPAYKALIKRAKYAADAGLNLVTYASKGYIPNFAGGGGIIQTLKDKAKSLIKNPIAQSLFDQAVETLLGLPEGFEASEVIKQINFALTASNPAVELGKIKKSKRSEKRQAKIQEYLSRNAAGGYFPNFAKDALEDAVVREQLQSGLPSSQISLTRDSRLANNLNPSGFAVINKRDEPNGKVPANRIADAYKNAGKGFIPNFSTSESQRADISLNTAASLGAAGTEEAKKAVQANINSGKKVSEAQIKLTDEILKYTKSLNLADEAQNKISKYLDNFGKSINRSGALNEAQINAISTRGGLSPDQSKALRNIGGISPASSATAGGAPAGNQSPQSPPDQAPREKATKSLGDLAQTAFIFQSGLSFATGALSTFGKEAEALGDVLNSIGQIGYTVMQGGDLFKQISKGRGLGDLISSVRRGAEVGAGGTTSTMSRLRGGLRGALVGTAAVEGGAAATGLGAGSGGAALMTGGALAAGVAAGGYLLYKSIDSIGKFMNGAATRTERAVNAFNDIQEKYNVQLSDKQRVTVDRLSELADVSGTSLSGAAAGSGYTFSQGFRSLKATLGFKDETYKNTFQQQIANSGLNLDAEGNQALAKSLGPLLAPIVTEATNKRGENGLIITAPQAEQDKLITELFSQKLKRINEILKEELKKPENFNFSKEEIEKIIKEKNLKSIDEIEQTGTDLSTRRTRTVTAEEQAKRELKKRKESDLIGVSAAKAARETAPESIAAQATLEAQKQAILIQTELLKKRLEITQQIAKIESTIPSALESSLSIQKELLSTNEASKFALDLQLKNLQEERQTRAEIKELFSNEARDIITKNLDRTSQLGVAAPKAEQVTGLFNNLQAAQSVEDQKKAYSEIVNQLDLSVSRQLEKINLLQEENKELEIYSGAFDDIIGKNNKEIAQLSIVNEQLRERSKILQGNLEVINKQSQARRIQAAQAAQERAITEKSNYYYTLQKDIFSAQIEIQNKKLEKAKQELDIRKQMRDLTFEEMQFADKTKTEPRKQYEAGMFAAQSKENDTVADVRMRNAEKAQAYRQSLYNDISSRTNNLDTMSAASKAATSGNTKELERLFSEAFGEQAQTFDQKVLTAANQFAQIIVQSAKDSEAIKKGEQPSTSYEAISSGKSVKGILESEYKDYKSKADITKELESLRSFYKELNYTDPQGDLVPKINELENILKQTSQDAAKFGLQAKQPVTEDETKIAENARRRKNLEQGRLTQGESERTTFTGGFKSAKNDIDLQIETFNSRLGKDIPMAFRDSMVSAMKELSNPNSTQPLKDRLLGVASAFLQKINEAFMTQAANKLTSSIMGPVTGMASGGYIKGGSGSKDDVPAMLMGGEYVVTKSAVQKYGPSFFDALNKGTIKKYASGGWVESDVTKYQDPTKINPYGQNRDKGLSFNESGQVIGMDSYSGKAENKQDAMMKAQSDYYAQNAQTGQGGFYMPGQNGMGGIMGARNLLAFATQQTTGTRFDKMSSRGGAASIDIGAGSSNLSLFALRDQDNIRNKEYLESKQKSSDLYFGSIDAAKEKANKEEEIRKEQERIKKEFEEQKKQARKQLIQGIVSSIASAAIMAGISHVGNSMSKGMSAAKQAASIDGRKTGFMEGAISGGTIGGENRGGLSNAFNSRGTMDFSTIGADALKVDGGGLYAWNKEAGGYSRMTNDEYSKRFPFGASYDSLGTPTALKNPNLYSKPSLPLFDSIGSPTDFKNPNLKSYNSNSLDISEGGEATYNNGATQSQVKEFLKWIKDPSGENPLKGNPALEGFKFPKRKAAGGFVVGNGMGDNVPTMLNGGEFVVSRQAAQNIGANKLQQINSGNTGNDSSEIITAKLDELVEKLSAVGTINITVNSDGKGGNQTQEDSSQNSDKQQKELAKKIKDVVIGVLREEKRLGGLLR